MNTQEIAQAGTVIDVKPNHSLVRVNVLGRETNWLPVLQVANAFKRGAIPLRVGQQVVVLVNRYVVGSLFSMDCPEPDGYADTIEITEYEDGTCVTYDTANKQMTINAVGDISIIASGDVTVEAAMSTVTAANAVVNADTSINGNATINGDLIVSGHAQAGTAMITGICAVGGLSASGGGSVSATGGMRIKNGDIEADGVSLKGHIHGETGTGGGTTTPPQ